MAVELTRVSRLYVEIDVAATLPGGGSATLTGVDVALIPVGAGPDASTVWTAATYAAGTATVLLAGPDAGGSGALVVPSDMDLWAKVTDAPEIDARKVTRVSVMGGTPASALPIATITDAYMAGLITGVTGTRDALDARYVNDGQGAGGALSGTYPNPGLNETTVDSIVAGKIPGPSSTATALRTALGPRGSSLALVGARPSAAQKILTAFQAGHGYTTNAGGTASLNDTTDFALGSQSVVVTTDGAGTAKTVKKVAQTAVDGTGKHAKVWVKVDAQAHVSSLQLYLGDTNLANNWKWEMKNSAAQPWMFDGEWTVWTLPFGMATVTGTPARAAITDVQMRVVDDATGTVTAHFGGVALVNTSTTFPSGVVSFTFDDTHLSTYTIARAYLDRYGFPATAYVIQDYVGQAARMTLDQLHTLERLSGWEIAGHATTGAIHNARITGMTDAQVQAEFAAIRGWLADNGFAGDHYAYPGGEYLSAQPALVEQFFTAGRTVYQRPETHPPARASKLRSKGYVTSSTTVASLTAAIDEAFTSGEWLIITNHDLVSSIGATTDQLITDFQTVVDYVNTKGIPVRTVGEVLRTKP